MEEHLLSSVRVSGARSCLTYPPILTSLFAGLANKHLLMNLRFPADSGCPPVAGRKGYRLSLSCGVLDHGPALTAVKSKRVVYYCLSSAGARGIIFIRK